MTHRLAGRGPGRCRRASRRALQAYAAAFLGENTGHTRGHVPAVTAGFDVDEHEEHLGKDVIQHPHQELEKPNVKMGHVWLSPFHWTVDPVRRALRRRIPWGFRAAVRGGRFGY